VPTTDRNRYAFSALGIAVVVGLALFVYSRRLPPQIGMNEDVFNTVDALFTAINSRDQQRLTDCERWLHTHRDAGTLPSAAAITLDAIIQQARSGQWEPAAHKLYDFMRGQRRTRK
jgi:hypothetical protein